MEDNMFIHSDLPSEEQLVTHSMGEKRSGLPALEKNGQVIGDRADTLTRPPVSTSSKD